MYFSCRTLHFPSGYHFYLFLISLVFFAPITNLFPNSKGPVSHWTVKDIRQSPVLLDPGDTAQGALCACSLWKGSPPHPILRGPFASLLCCGPHGHTPWLTSFFWWKLASTSFLRKSKLEKKLFETNSPYLKMSLFYPHSSLVCLVYKSKLKTVLPQDFEGLALLSFSFWSAIEIWCHSDAWSLCVLYLLTLRKFLGSCFSASVPKFHKSLD